MCSLEPSLLADLISTGIMSNSDVIGKKHTYGVQSHIKKAVAMWGRWSSCKTQDSGSRGPGFESCLDRPIFLSRKFVPCLLKE